MPSTCVRGICALCGGPVEWFKGEWERRTCSKECFRELTRKNSTGRKMPAWFGEMRRRAFTDANPMRSAVTRAKVSKTLKRIKHSPKVRGGNGKGATVPERLLADALGWHLHVVVKTGCPSRGVRSGSGYPTCYKLDVADESTKTCIEVDGPSHFSRRAQDAKKTAFLNGLGWKVFRVTNREVLKELPSTISKLKALIPTLRTTS